MILADTTVAVAAALRWHEHHAAARAALAGERTRLLAHVGLETYSVLTRLPPPHRVPAAAAWECLRTMFMLPAAVLQAKSYERLLDEVAGKRITGGAVYDALVAVTAREAGGVLLTLDRRAETTYRLLEIEYRLVA